MRSHRTSSWLEKSDNPTDGADTQSPEAATPRLRSPAPQSTSNDDIGSDWTTSRRSTPTPDPLTGAPSTANDDIGSDWATSRRSIFADLDDDDVAPPLYRDSSPESGRSEETATRTTGTRPPDANEAEVDTGRQTWVRPALANAPRRFRLPDPEATTILPRTSSGSVGSRGWQDSIDDFSDIDEGRWRLGRRTKLALLIAGVAAVVVVGLAIGRAVLVGDTPTTSPSAGSSATSAPSGVPPAELLNDDAMLNAKDAKRVSSDRTWKVALTQRGTTADSAKPACLGEPAEGQPMSALTMLRLLSANGKEPPGIMHQADAFTTPDEAGQAFAVAAKTLGGCAEMGGYIQSGWSVSGLGDQAVGLVVAVERDGKTVVHHSVVLNRTGRVTNVMDVVKQRRSRGDRQGGQCSRCPDGRSVPQFGRRLPEEGVGEACSAPHRRGRTRLPRRRRPAARCTNRLLVGGRRSRCPSRGLRGLAV